MKICSHCKQTLQPTEFYKNRSRPDGLGHRCKVCALKSVMNPSPEAKKRRAIRVRLYMREYRKKHPGYGNDYKRNLKESNPEKLREIYLHDQARKKQRYQTEPEFRKKVIQSSLDYYYRNRERVKARKRAWYLKKKEQE